MTIRRFLSFPWLWIWVTYILQDVLTWNSPPCSQRVTFPYICRVLHSLHLTSAAVDPNMVLHQAGPCLAIQLQSDEHNTEPKSNCSRRKKWGMIWYTFLTSLSCGCVELWNNRYFHSKENTLVEKTKKKKDKWIYNEGNVSHLWLWNVYKEGGGELSYYPIYFQSYSYLTCFGQTLSFWCAKT